MKHKTFAPLALDLRAIMESLPGWTVPDVAKYLDVTERSVWRWLSDESAPRAALLALWHLTPHGLECVGVDYGNGVMYERGLSISLRKALDAETARLGRLLAISDTGAANDALMNGPHGPPPKPRTPFAASLPRQTPQASSCSRLRSPAR